MNIKTTNDEDIELAQVKVPSVKLPSENEISSDEY